MNIYILEDEKNIYNYLLQLLAKIPFVKVIGHSPSISKAMKEIPVLKPDLVLADIKLEDGLSLSLFSQIEINFQLIFITAFNQYAIDALNLGALAYLLKPIVPLKLNESIYRCSKKQDTEFIQKLQLDLALLKINTNEAPTRIALSGTDFTQIILIEDIVYCQGDQGYTTFYLKNGSKIVVSKVLKDYEELLSEKVFIRCHQSYIVNINAVDKYYREGYLELFSKEKIPVSERKKKVVKEFIETKLN